MWIYVLYKRDLFPKKEIIKKVFGLIKNIFQIFFEKQISHI